MKINKSSTGDIQKLSSILKDYKPEKSKGYITREFQDYGYRLALELDDSKRVSLYIKLAKQYDRVLLEQARNFVKDAPNVNSRARLFMWKLKQLSDKKVK